MEGEKIRATRWVMKRERWTGSRKEIPGKDTVNPDRHFEEEEESMKISNTWKSHEKEVEKCQECFSQKERRTHFSKASDQEMAETELKSPFCNLHHTTTSYIIMLRMSHHTIQTLKIPVVLCDLTRKNPRGTFCLTCL